MIAYLSETPLPLPSAIESSATGLDTGTGTLTPEFERGALFLRNEADEVVRLSWNEEDGGEADDEPSARALPAGEYRLVSYRILRDDGTDRWHISSTGAAIKKFRIDEGADYAFELDETIQISSRLSGGRAQMMISGENRAGLSIYKNGRRIPIGYRVWGSGGEELTSGDMNYG